MEHSEFDSGITAYERQFWQVLAALGRAGYSVPPQDARDLIHDFYLEEVPGVLRRYDSGRSQFATYLSAAFYRFARRRILRLQRWRQRTVDLEQADELASAADIPEQALEWHQQTDLIRAALRGLPALEQAILYDFLETEQPNERALAQQHSMTRYRLRETLANSVGRLLLALSGEPAPAAIDARVAKGLWVDGQSPHHVAALLGITTPEVNHARLRFTAGLMRTLRQLNRQDKPVRRKTMSTDFDMLIRALCSPNDAGAIAEVRDRSAQIRAALVNGGLELSAQQREYLEKNPEWVGAVYAALLSDLDSGEDTDVALAIRQVMEGEDAEIGAAFVELLAQLEESGYDWMARFRPLPMPGELEREQLQEEGALPADDPSAIGLLSHGITPAIIYEATRGLYLLFERVEGSMVKGSEAAEESWLREATPADEGMSLIGADGAVVHIPHRIIVAEIEGTPNLLPGRAEALSAWIGDVVQFQPFLVEGYAYDANERGFARWQTPGGAVRDDLIAQWSRRARGHARPERR